MQTNMEEEMDTERPIMHSVACLYGVVCLPLDVNQIAC